MSRKLIAASSVLSLAACVAGPVHKSATAGQDGAAVTPSISVQPPHPSLTTLAWGEEEDGSGTVVSTMAIGEEDGHWPVVTSLTHGEEEDGRGTQIEDEPIIIPELQSFLVQPASSVADIMARLRLSQG
jgi:hypothetical protein